jgi:hypothetical protein
MGEGVDVGADVVVMVESVVMLLVVLVLTLTEEVDVVLAVVLVLPTETDELPVAGENTDKRQLAPHMRVESPAHGILQSESGSSDAAGSVLPQ